MNFVFHLGQALRSPVQGLSFDARFAFAFTQSQNAISKTSRGDNIVDHNNDDSYFNVNDVSSLS
jgi:hypothetical protein